MVDISKIPTSELREIRNILKYGAKASASRAGDEARRLAAENAELRKVNQRRNLVESSGLDWDSNYWMSLDDKTFNFVLEKMQQVKTEVAIAERAQSLKIPPIISVRELNTIDTIRQGFNEIKDRSNGNKELN